MALSAYLQSILGATPPPTGGIGIGAPAGPSPEDEEMQSRKRLMDAFSTAGAQPTTASPAPAYMIPHHLLIPGLIAALVGGIADPQHQAGNQIIGGLMKGGQQASQNENQRRTAAIQQGQQKSLAKVQAAKAEHDAAVKRLTEAGQEHQRSILEAKNKQDATDRQNKEKDTTKHQHNTELLNILNHLQGITDPKQKQAQYDMALKFYPEIENPQYRDNLGLPTVVSQNKEADTNLKGKQAASVQATIEGKNEANKQALIIDPIKVKKAIADADNAVKHGKHLDAVNALAPYEKTIKEWAAKSAPVKYQQALAQVEHTKALTAKANKGPVGEKGVTATAQARMNEGRRKDLEKAQTDMDKAKGYLDVYSKMAQDPEVEAKDKAQATVNRDYYRAQFNAAKGHFDRLNSGGVPSSKSKPRGLSGKLPTRSKYNDGWGELK